MPRMYRGLKAYCTTLSPPHPARCHHACNDMSDPSSERWNRVGENGPVILPKWRLPRHLGIFYMPQIYDVGPVALLPSKGRRAEDFFALKNPDGFGRVWTRELGYLKAARYP
jgi:hypothetical protein